MSEEMKDNLSNADHWIRLLFVLVYGMIIWVGLVPLAILVLLQLLIYLLTGKPNANLRSLGGTLGDYLKGITRYALFDSDERPFPFGDWDPEEEKQLVTKISSEVDEMRGPPKKVSTEPASSGESSDSKKSGSSQATAKKSASKKKASKKKTSKKKASKKTGSKSS